MINPKEWYSKNREGIRFTGQLFGISLAYTFAIGSSLLVLNYSLINTNTSQTTQEPKSGIQRIFSQGKLKPFTPNTRTIRLGDNLIGIDYENDGKIDATINYLIPRGGEPHIINFE